MNTYENLIKTTRRLPEGSDLRRKAEEQIRELRGWSPQFRNEKAGAILSQISPVANATWAASAGERAKKRSQKEAARRARQLERAAAQPSAQKKGK